MLAAFLIFLNFVKLIFSGTKPNYIVNISSQLLYLLENKLINFTFMDK